MAEEEAQRLQTQLLNQEAILGTFWVNSVGKKIVP